MTREGLLSHNLGQFPQTLGWLSKANECLILVKFPILIPQISAIYNNNIRDFPKKIRFGEDC